MIYLVSGFMRSGTSMCMEALEAGGLEAVYSADRDKRMNDKWGEADSPVPYTPNDKFYELDADDYRKSDFPLCHEGKLVKCLWGGITRLPVGEYRVVYMRRPRNEIRTSLIAFFGNSTPIVDALDFDQLMERIVSILRDRASFKSVDEIWYGDVLADPLRVFRKLADHGWPIDADKAATIPEARRARCSA
jgi:hypothetical protein